MEFAAAGFGGVVAEEEAGAFDAAPIVLVEIGGMEEGTVVVNYEGEIGNLVTLLQEHLLVEGLHLIKGTHSIGRKAVESLARGGVEVLGAAEDLKAVALRDGARVPVQEHAVGLEVDYAAGLQEGAVTIQEERRSEAAVLAAELGVGESEPDLRDLAGGEVSGDELDARAQEGYIA